MKTTKQLMILLIILILTISGMIAWRKINNAPDFDKKTPETVEILNAQTIEKMEK